MSSPDDLVIAHQSTTPAEAEIVRGILEGNGIAAVIPDKNMPLPGVDLTPFSAQGGAGCDVLVPARDLDRATEIIKAARDSARDSETESDDGGDGGE